LKRSSEVGKKKPLPLDAVYDAQLKKMLAYIAADISSILIQFQIFLSLIGRHPGEIMSTAQQVSFGVWIIGSGVVGVAVTVAIIVKFHELVFLESKVGTWRFHDLFASKRSRTAEVWIKLIQKVFGTTDQDMKSDKLWGAQKRVIRMKHAVDGITVICIILWLLPLAINVYFLATSPH
jgi:hypothetical protein